MVDGDALKCCVSVCSAVWVELSAGQIRCGYLDLDLHMRFPCSTLILLTCTRVDRRDGKRKQRKHRTWRSRRLKWQKRIITQKQFNNSFSQYFPLSSELHQKSPANPTVFTSSSTAQAGSYRELPRRLRLRDARPSWGWGSSCPQALLSR